MMRTSLTKLARPALLSRTFATTARAMSAGDTGSPPKTGGMGDAFQRRERANENYAIQQREREKLLELKKRLAEQQDHMKKLEEHIDEITREQGGERN
ncbi:mitochondrial ATPase inhibitor, IATP-domain-containing protein [Staphylotrichum tortipilum]|uniref:ATPase inhibitor, mitochondrial n=1 Tax=Staphylotrichum tortipilum TaxID=2831512 RepID=A0AAN6RXU8_9PEZI|nr:mitochondrial ATPase inhibitor, IATP-domain-containing protein [Staphylotrichum longicolle]